MLCAGVATKADIERLEKLIRGKQAKSCALTDITVDKWSVGAPLMAPTSFVPSSDPVPSLSGTAAAEECTAPAH